MDSDPVYRLNDFDHLHEHLERMWERLTGGRPDAPRFGPRVIEPPTDVYITAEAVMVVMEVSGIRGRDVELTFADGSLTVSGEKLDPREERGERMYTQIEIAHGMFARTLALPVPVDIDRATLHYIDGVLEITLPKRDPNITHRITVTVRES